MHADRPGHSEYRALELRARIHTAEQVVFIFRGLDEWVRHVIRHFGNRREPWARVLKDAAPAVYSLRDRIPGNTDAAKEAFLDQIDCQKEEPRAVMILRKACEAYAKAGTLIVDQLRAGLERPRYAHFPRSNPLAASQAGGRETTYAIAEPCPAVMVVRGADLRTCYFIPGVRGTSADLPAVQSYLFRKCGVCRSPQTWVDRHGSIAHPYTERTLGWAKLSEAGPIARVRQFRRPGRGAES